MTSAAEHTKQANQPGGRFTEPETPVSQRIDALIVHCPNQKDQAQWLKQALKARWSKDLPQPFIGFDDEDGTFVAEWQSDTECNTLAIDAGNHRGWYHPWPDPAAGELSEELDLDRGKRGNSCALPSREPDHSGRRPLLPPSASNELPRRPGIEPGLYIAGHGLVATLRFGGWQRRKDVTTIQPAGESFGNSLASLFSRMAPAATRMPVSVNRFPFRQIVTTIE